MEAATTKILKVNSQLIRGIHTKKLPQIITKVCKFTRNTAITQKNCPEFLRKCASLLEIQQFGCISSKFAHFRDYLGQFFCWDTTTQL